MAPGLALIGRLVPVPVIVEVLIFETFAFRSSIVLDAGYAARFAVLDWIIVKVFNFKFLLST